jgi:formylglycine-generating enzyme required for sulfatase activity
MPRGAFDFWVDEIYIVRAVEAVSGNPPRPTARTEPEPPGPTAVATSRSSTPKSPDIRQGPHAPQSSKRATATAPPKEIKNGIGIKMVLVPRGEFDMGSPGSDGYAQADEKPKHHVQITRPFYLGICEVTQGQYRSITGENPSHFRGSDDLPVESVSWMAAISFCNRLSQREGLKPYYALGTEAQSGGSGYRLPTEAEWEYACRAGSASLYGFGDTATRLGEFAWFGKNSDNKTHPVGHKLANAWGLYDMRGNVGEWCWDWYNARYYGQSPGADPLGPSLGEARVWRGLGCHASLEGCRVAHRSRRVLEAKHDYIGFRVARAQPGP